MNSIPPPYPQTPPQNEGNPAYDSRIQLCPDGKYRWIYEYSMMKNPVILLVIFKIFGGVILGLWLLFGIIGLLGGDGLEAMWGMGKVLLIIAAVTLGNRYKCPHFIISR